MNKQHLAGASLVLTLGLQACGGGATDGTSQTATASAQSAERAATQAASTTSAKPDAIAGVVTGGGAGLVIDGARFATRRTRVSSDINPAAPVSVPLTDLAPGMTVTASSTSTGTLATVVVSATVAGPITAVSSTQITVAGQTVKPRTGTKLPPTVYDGVSGFSDLTVGQRVVVYGTASNGTVTASRIEVRDPSAAVFTRVNGSISGLDSTAKRFKLGKLSVDYAGAKLVSGVVLANGNPVAVWADSAPTSANLLVARSIAPALVAPADGDTAQAGGLVTALDSGATRFSVAGLVTDYSAASFANGTAANLANGRAVRALGSFSDGVLHATSVAFVLPQASGAYNLTGGITGFVPPSRFMLRGVAVDASQAGFVNGSADNLAEGVVVKVKASSTVADDAGVLKADSVEFVTGSGSHVFAGKVAGYDATAGRFTLMGVAMQLGSATTFANADGSAASRADLGNGDTVTVRGGYSGGVFQVASLRFRTGATVVITEVPGLSHEVNATAGSFVLNGSLVRTTGSTVVVNGSLSSLTEGTSVTVSGSATDGVITASSIVIEQPGTGSAARVTGAIDGYVSAASFSIDGQAVDASAASYLNGSAADLADGVAVTVTGPLSGGVLKAKTLRLR